MQHDTVPTQKTELTPEDVSRIIDWKSAKQREAEKSKWDFSDPDKDFTDPRDPIDHMDQFKIQAFIESHAEVTDDRFNFGVESNDRTVRMHGPAEAYAAVLMENGLEAPDTYSDEWNNSTADGYLTESEMAVIKERVEGLTTADDARKVQIESALVAAAVARKAQEYVDSTRDAVETESRVKQRRHFGAGIVSRLVRRQK